MLVSKITGIPSAKITYLGKKPSKEMIINSSPLFTVAKRALNRTCFPPAPTDISFIS